MGKTGWEKIRNEIFSLPYCAINKLIKMQESKLDYIYENWWKMRWGYENEIDIWRRAKEYSPEGWFSRQLGFFLWEILGLFPQGQSLVAKWTSITENSHVT